MKSFIASALLFTLATVSFVSASPLDRRVVTCGTGTKSDGNGGCVCTAVYGTTVNNACSCSSTGGWPQWNAKLGQCSPVCNQPGSKLNANGVQCDCGTGAAWRGPGQGCMCNSDGEKPDSKGNCKRVCTAAGTAWTPGTGGGQGSCQCTAVYGQTVNGACYCDPNGGWPVWNSKLKQCSPKCDTKLSTLNANGVQCDCKGAGISWRGPNSGCKCDDDSKIINAQGVCVPK